MIMPPEAGNTVHIIDDDADFTEIVRAVVKNHTDDVKTYINADEFIKDLNPLIRGVVLLDLELPGMSGFGVLDHLMRHNIHIPVVVLSAYDDWESVRGAFKRGALDFLPKSSSLLKISNLVSECLKLEQKMSSARVTEQEVYDALQTLSKREREVLNYLADGYTSKEISRISGVAPRTADVHRHNIFQKFSVNSLPQLMNKLAKAGFYNNTHGWAGNRRPAFGELDG